MCENGEYCVQPPIQVSPNPQPFVPNRQPFPDHVLKGMRPEARGGNPVWGFQAQIRKGGGRGLTWVDRSQERQPGLGGPNHATCLLGQWPRGVVHGRRFYINSKRTTMMIPFVKHVWTVLEMIDLYSQSEEKNHTIIEIPIPPKPLHSKVGGRGGVAKEYGGPTDCHWPTPKRLPHHANYVCLATIKLFPIDAISNSSCYFLALSFVAW